MADEAATTEIPLPPLFYEHSLAVEVWLDDRWAPGWLFYRPEGLLRVEAFDGDGVVREWELLRAYSFSDVAPLLHSPVDMDPRPLLRLDLRLVVEEFGRRRTKAARLVVWGEPYQSRGQGGEPTYESDTSFELWMDGREEPMKSVDLLTLAQDVPELVCCGTCALGNAHTLGGADFAFGMHCFRDRPEAAAPKHYSLETYDALGRKNTPVLHLCPAYRRRDRRI